MSGALQVQRLCEPRLYSVSARGAEVLLGELATTHSQRYGKLTFSAK